MADYTGDFLVEEDDTTARADIRYREQSPAAKDTLVSNIASGKQRTPGAGSPNPEAVETDAHRLAQRQKQVDYGKNTLGYQRYIQLIPKEQRRKRDPSTPDIHQGVSKRCFDGQVKAWRRALHQYDTERAGADADARPDSTTPRGGRNARPRDNNSSAGKGRGNGRGRDQDFDVGSPMDRASIDSQGSLEGYLGPGYNNASRKRQFQNAFPPPPLPPQNAPTGFPAPPPPPPPPPGQPLDRNDGANNEMSRQESADGMPRIHVVRWDEEGSVTGDGYLVPNPEPIEEGPQPKRSTASRSMDISQHAQQSTAGTAHAQPTGPTSFAGIGLAARVGNAAPGHAQHGMPPLPPHMVPPHMSQQQKPAGIKKEDNVVALILGEDNSCMSWRDGEDSNIGL